MDHLEQNAEYEITVRRVVNKPWESSSTATFVRPRRGNETLVFRGPAGEFEIARSTLVSAVKVSR